MNRALIIAMALAAGAKAEDAGLSPGAQSLANACKEGAYRNDQRFANRGLSRGAIARSCHCMKILDVQHFRQSQHLRDAPRLREASDGPVGRIGLEDFAD